MTGLTRLRLGNVTDSNPVAISCTVSYGSTNHQGMIPCILPFYIDIGSQKDFRIECYCSVARANDGLGAHDGASLGIEIYSQILIEKF